MVVKFQVILEAFEFVSFAQMDEHQAFLEKETGKIFYHSDFDDDGEELPEDIDDEKYIVIPHKNDLGLGKKLALDFAHQHLRDEVAMIHAMFNRKGAYSSIRICLSKEESWNSGMNMNRKNKKRP